MANPPMKEMRGSVLRSWISARVFQFQPMEVDDVRAVLAIGRLVVVRLPERLVHAALQLQQRLVFLESKLFLTSDTI